MLVYELHRKEWLGIKSKGSFVEHDKFFGPFLKHQVSFYDERRNVLKIEKERWLKRKREKRIRFIFAHIDDYF